MQRKINQVLDIQESEYWFDIELFNSILQNYLLIVNTGCSVTLWLQKTMCSTNRCEIVNRWKRWKNESRKIIDEIIIEIIKKEIIKIIEKIIVNRWKNQ